MPVLGQGSVERSLSTLRAKRSAAAKSPSAKSEAQAIIRFKVVGRKGQLRGSEMRRPCGARVWAGRVDRGAARPLGAWRPFRPPCYSTLLLPRNPRVPALRRASRKCSSGSSRDARVPSTAACRVRGPATGDQVLRICAPKQIRGKGQTRQAWVQRQNLFIRVDRLLALAFLVMDRPEK